MSETAAIPTATGSFAKTPFAHLLVYLHTRELSGTLEIRGADTVHHVYVQKGCPAKVRCGLPVEPLGKVLLDMGLIDGASYQSSLQALAGGQGLQGQILLGMGALAMPALIRGLKEQLTRKLLRLFELREADYSYFDGVNVLRGYGGDEVLRIDPLPILYRGVRASYDDPRLEALLGPVRGQPLRILESVDVRRFGLSTEEIDLCTRLQTEALPLDRIEQDSPVPRLHTRALVYCLLITKQIEFVTAPTEAAPAPAREPVAPAREPVAPAREPVAPAVARPRPAAAPPRTPTVRPSPIPAPGTGARASVPAVPSPARRSSAPAVPARPVEDPDAAQLRADIIARAERIEAQSYFEMLEVHPDANADAVRDAYFKLAKLYHPDRARADLEDLRDTLEYIFSNFNEAYATLSDKEKRNRYVSLLREGGGTMADQRKIQGIVDGAMNYQKAEVCLRRRDYAEAMRLAELAVRASPDDGEYLALYAYIQLQQRAADAEINDLLEALRRAQARAKESEKPNFYLAMALKRAGNMPLAITYFKRASVANPRNLDAIRELRLYEMRREKGGGPPDPGPKGGPKGKPPTGLLGRFFKK